MSSIEWQLHLVPDQNSAKQWLTVLLPVVPMHSNWHRLNVCAHHKSSTNVFASMYPASLQGSNLYLQIFAAAANKYLQKHFDQRAGTILCKNMSLKQNWNTGKNKFSCAVPMHTCKNVPKLVFSWTPTYNQMHETCNCMQQ